MTLLIDPPNSPGHGRMWSHLASDVSFEELHAFAAGLGIPRRGFDRDHYDIPAERYDDVVAAGAVPVTSRELIDRLRRAGLRRRKADTLGPRRAGRPLVRPPRLRPGDAVCVVAPSGPVPTDRLEAGLAVLRAWGLDVREGPHLRGGAGHAAYLAAADADRAGDLAAAWCDRDVRAVFCARGGYGTQRVLDLLDWAALAAAGPKPLVGFSDVTALHAAFASRLGLVTLHGPVVTSLGVGDDLSREHLRRTLFSPEDALLLTPEPAELLVAGSGPVEGVLVGGNVAVLSSGVGTPVERTAGGGIVVLEDVGEQAYRLDRALTHLLRSGWFDGAVGVAAGAFPGCGSDDSVRGVLRDRLGGLGVPVLLGVPVGHGPRNVTVPLGVRAVLDGDAGTLTLREPALV